VQVIMTRAGAARMSSPQFSSANEMAGEGQSFILGTGGALPAGQDLTLALAGLPARSRLGRNLSLALAVLLLLAGAWAAMSAKNASGDVSRLAALVERRDRLMADLVRLEEQLRAGTIDGRRHAVRHEELVAQLERVYGELDRQPGAAAEV
jgi:membrane protein DedA with SNARE-associated domain